MPYVSPATGQVIPRRARRDKPSTSTTTQASSSPPSAATPSSTGPAETNPTIGVDNADLLTPRPISTQSNVDALSADLAAASIDDQPGPSRRQGSDTSRADRARKGSDDRRSSTSKTTTSSSMSEADLSASESSASLTSLSTQSEIGTPPTTSTTPEMLADVEARALGEGGAGADGVEIRVMRYREGLYAYTRNLYLEAKLSQTKKAGGTTINQFGLKQSGMERLAAKKALARRLNA